MSYTREDKKKTHDLWRLAAAFCSVFVFLFSTLLAEWTFGALIGLATTSLLLGIGYTLYRRACVLEALLLESRCPE